MTSMQPASSKTESGPFFVDAEVAESFGRWLLVAHGLPEEDATTVAHCLVLADFARRRHRGLQTLPD